MQPIPRSVADRPRIYKITISFTMKKILLTLCAALLCLSAVAQQSRHNFETAKQLDIFNSIYKMLDLYYVDTLDAKKNIENAVLYMLDQLDPYTVYYPENETGELRQLTTGKYAGIGAIISYRKDLSRCIINQPYEGMPAAEAGLRRGDVILSIDGKDTGTCTADDPGDFSTSVSEALRGQPGTQFEVRVQRPGHERPMTFKLTRRAITLPSVVLSKVLSDSIGYVRLDSYTENTARDVRRAIVELKQQGAKRLVLDLRGNPGGLMDQAVDVVNLFIPRGKEVLSTRGKVAERNATYKTQSEPLDVEIPLVVLVDFGTASAAEITAGALQDYDRAVIVGRRTYGKGLVQETRQLPYDNILKLTTSKYYIPSGRCVQAYTFKDGVPQHLPDSLSKAFRTAAGRVVHDGGGITPDVEIELDSLPTLITYLALSDQLFDYTVQYRNTHDRIAAPDSFRITDADYAEFRQYLKDHNFTYDRQSRSVLDLLRRVADREGYAEEAKAEFDALEAKLTHNEDFDFQRWEKEVRQLVERTIVADYYYQAGQAAYDLRDDKDLEEALRLVRDDARRRALLAPPVAE